jgi:hypothetical protein
MREHEPQDDDAGFECLADVPAALPPPPELEGRVIERLRSQGLLTKGAAIRRRGWLLAAVALGIFGTGVVVGRSLAVPGAAPRATYGQTYALLLYAGPAFAAAVSEREAERVAEYRGWMEGLVRQGRVASGEKLDDRFLLVGEPLPEGLEPGGLLGFFLIEATSLESAAQVAAASPHVRHGGSVEIRQVASGR